MLVDYLYANQHRGVQVSISTSSVGHFRSDLEVRDSVNGQYMQSKAGFKPKRGEMKQGEYSGDSLKMLSYKHEECVSTLPIKFTFCLAHSEHALSEFFLYLCVHTIKYGPCFPFCLIYICNFNYRNKSIWYQYNTCIDCWLGHALCTPCIGL